MVAAAKINGTHAALAPKKSREIRGILETEFPGDTAHRTGRIYQATPSLQGEALLDQIEGRASGKTLAQPIQTRFGQRQMPCVALHRPMLEIVRFDQVAEATQPLCVAAAMDFGTAVRGGTVC